jgi:hypothetical protein
MDLGSNSANRPGTRANSLSSQIKQRLLLYGAHSKITYIHCLMAISPEAMREVGLVLEGYPQPFRRPGYTPS